VPDDVEEEELAAFLPEDNPITYSGACEKP
jgi:hypothetical protein